MADNYNDIVIIDDSGSSGEEQKIYTKIFGYVIDENYNPVYSEAGKEPIVVKLNDLEYTLTTASNYFEFNGQDVITLREGMITVFDGNEDTVFNWNAASHTFTGAAKTRLNIKIKMPYKRINMGDVRPEEMNLRTININITNGSTVAQRLIVTAKDGNENDLDEFPESLSISGNTITCTIQYGYMIKFVDPNNEFYDYTLTINTVGQSAYTIHLAPKTPEVYISINVHIYDYEDHDEEITSSSWVSIDGEDKPIGESAFNVTQYSTIIANNSEYLADYKIIESTTSPQTINFYLKKQANASGHTDEDWHEVYQGIPWYVDKIDLKYTAVDIYSSKKAQLTHEKINILPFTDTNCVGQYDGNIVKSDGSTRPSRLNDLNYTRNVNINENIYQFLFELKKGNYPIDFLEAADKDTKTLELHTFEPTPIKVKQRKMNGGSPDYINYNPENGEGDPYIVTGANNIISGFIDVTYNGESQREKANNIISAKYISWNEPWNTIGLTSSQMASLDNVYLQPVINTANTGTDNIEVSEKQEHINRLSILYDNIICHSESYTFPYLPDGSSLKPVELIYGQKNKNINVGPLKYKFVQDEEESTIYSLQSATNEKYIPKFKIDEIRLGEGPLNNYTTEINNEYLKINTTNPILLESGSTLNIAYHMNDDAHAENQVISVNCSVVSSPEVILTGYTFNNVDNYNFKYITNADALVTENYFSGALSVNAASQYSFILYSKSPGDTPENLLTSTIESQTGDISENELIVHNNVSLSVSDGSDIKYTLTSLTGTNGWMDYNSTINNAYNNILGTYYTKSGERLLIKKTKISYSYINDIIVNDNLSCSYKLNNNEYVYNVKTADDKYNGKYYLYGNNEAFDELSIFGRWNEESNITYIYSTNNSLPAEGNIIRVEYTENDIQSLTASIYNLLTDGTMFVAPDITTNNKVILLTNEDNNNNELLKQQNIIMDIKGQMHAALGHNYIVQTNNDGTNYTNTFLYTTLSSSNYPLYVGPTFNKITGSNKFKINYSNFTFNETLTSEINNTLIKGLADVSAGEQGDDYINNHKYDWDNFDTQTVSEDVSDKYYDLFKSGNLSYNSLISRSMPVNIRNYYENYIYKYDKEKYGEDTPPREYYNHSFVIYTANSQSQYDNFREYVNTYTVDPTWCETVGYTVAKSFILGFTYSYIYNSIVKYGNAATENYYKVGPINLTNTELYSYNIRNNNTVNIVTNTGTTYSGLLTTNGTNVADGIELFKSSSNLVANELSFFTDYNNTILSYINAAFTYNDSNNAITLEQMYNLFGNTSINITTTNNTIDNNLEEYLVLDKRLRTFKLKLKSDNGNYNDDIINYALCMKILYNDFIPKLATGIKKYNLVETQAPGEVHYTNPTGVTLADIKSYIKENYDTNDYYFWKVTNNTYSELRYWTVSQPGEGEDAAPIVTEYYGYEQGGSRQPVDLTKVSQVYIITADSQKPEYSISTTPEDIDLQGQKCTNLFTLFDLWNLSEHNYKITYRDILNNTILSSLLRDMGITLTGKGENQEYITFDPALYEKYTQNKTLFNIANQQSNSYDTSKQSVYRGSIIYHIPNLTGDPTNGYTTNPVNATGFPTGLLANGLLYGLAELCYNLIKLAIPAFAVYKENINKVQQNFDTERTNILTRIKNNTPESKKYPVIQSFDTIAYIDDEKPGINKFYDVYNEIKYLEEYGQKLMIINYLKRALAFAKGKGEEMDNYVSQLSKEITKEKILSEIDFVNRWITSRLLSYRKNNNTDRIQWGTGTNKLAFNPEWIDLITANEYTVNTIYCNGYNIYKLNKDIYTEENILNYPGLHLRYVINESISEITANTDVYSMTDIKKFRGTIYQTCEELKKRTNNVLHLLLYYYDGFIKEVKVTNNILNNAYKVNNIGCVYEEVNGKLLITFDATGISEDNIDTNKFTPSIEVEYCHTEETEYTQITVVNNSGFYINIPLSDNKLCHIRYRMKWSSSTGISIYSGYNNIVYFYDPADDGYSYKSLEFTTLNGPTTQNINSILNNALDLQLFAKRSTGNSEINTYYVADYRSSMSNKNIGFKFITKVNGDDQIVMPTLSKNYTNYSLNIITLDNIGNHFTPETLPGVNGIVTNKKYVLTKG